MSAKPPLKLGNQVTNSIAVTAKVIYPAPFGIEVFSSLCSSSSVSAEQLNKLYVTPVHFNRKAVQKTLMTNRLATSKSPNILLAILFAITSCFATNGIAQDSSFDKLPLNGLASFSQLRKEYYIGGLYLERLSQDTESAINISGKKRMAIHITIDKWSPRRFAKQWNQAILINNEQESLEEFTDQILAFTDIPKYDLIAGDRIVINMDPDNGTTVYLNDQRMLKTPNNAFFDILLNTWIGQRPPSSDFKNDILTLPTDAGGTELLLRYEATAPEKSRKKVVARWVQSRKTTAAPQNTASRPATAPPPMNGTTVTAKHSGQNATKTKTKTAITAVSVAVAVAATPKPALALDKPKLTVAIEKPKAAPTAKPVPKASPKVVEKTKAPEKKTTSKPKKPQPNTEKLEQEQEQEKLMRTYRSNILKLTYLNTQYPQKAMNFRQEGLVILKVRVNRKGKVLEIIEETISEHKLLNKAAKKAIKRTAPYPESPKNLKGDEIIISLPFNFKL